MSNIQIESDLKEVLGEINSKLGKIDGRLNNIEISQARLALKDILPLLYTASHKEKFDAQEKIVTELKGSQNKQIWALIVLAFTAIVILVIGLGKFIFFPNQ